MATKSIAPESVVRDINRKSRRQLNAEEKILLLPFAEKKLYIQLSITNGVKNSWKQGKGD